jgi:hypothetical protein
LVWLAIFFIPEVLVTGIVSFVFFLACFALDDPEVLLWAIGEATKELARRKPAGRPRRSTPRNNLMWPDCRSVRDQSGLHDLIARQPRSKGMAVQDMVAAQDSLAAAVEVEDVATSSRAGASPEVMMANAAVEITEDTVANVVERKWRLLLKPWKQRRIRPCQCKGKSTVFFSSYAIDHKLH